MADRTDGTKRDTKVEAWTPSDRREIAANVGRPQPVFEQRAVAGALAGRDAECPPKLGQQQVPPGVPLNVGRPNDPDRFSGFIIIRLRGDLIEDKARTLDDLVNKFDLKGLERVLDEHKLVKTAPVLRGINPTQVRQLEAKAARTRLRPLRSLCSYWRIDVRDRFDDQEIERVLKRLEGLPEVDRAYRELEVTDPVVNPGNDPYNASQGYLDPAPDGIDARWMWTQPSGEGAGVGLVDLEQGWFPGHEDLVGKSPTLIYGDNRDGVGTYKGNHGTAVLGQAIAVDNALGVVGIAPGVTSVRMTSHYDAGTNTALNVAAAIVAAIPTMNLGDVLLLEVQRSYKPTEIDDADFDAIRLAVAHGIAVVEAAGNGNTDLDAYVNSSGDAIFDRADPDFRDSGAIMVGAASSATPHERMSFSNYGNRIDCFAWGENVTTCGYGDLDDGGGDDDKTYTSGFNGTSSASPIIAGAALLLQAKYEATTGSRLSPLQMRALLTDPATATPQGTVVAGSIGVMPNLKQIARTTLYLAPDVYVRDAVGDTGDVPFAGSISASPDVILRPSAVVDPQAAFGEGSGTENSNLLGFKAEAGQDNHIYVRVRNRGGADAASVQATVYWSEVSTLVTPDMWNLVGTATLPVVPADDTLVVSPAILWPKGQIPATGHYCFVATLGHPDDDAPPLPGPMAWSDFQALIRNNNNVTWRNFNVVDDLPDPGGDPVHLPFRLAGAPDRARAFDLEIVRRAPAQARIMLELPLVAARQVVGLNDWKVEINREKKLARIHLPPLPRVTACGVRLPAGARYAARFVVHGAKGMERGGHGVAIRQLYDGVEVGRVTWQFHRRRTDKPC